MVTGLEDIVIEEVIVVGIRGVVAVVTVFKEIIVEAVRMISFALHNQHIDQMHSAGIIRLIVTVVK